MNQLSYNREGGRRTSHGGGRVFRLNSRRFSVQGLRVRFNYLFRILGRLRNSYKGALRLLKKGVQGRRNDGGWRRLAAAKEAPPAACRMKSFGRSNSFYNEAIADCLEFIKRNSFSVDQIQDPKPLLLPGDD